MGVFAVNLHKTILTQHGISGQSHRFGRTLVSLGTGGKRWLQVNPWWVSAGIQQTPTLQRFSPSNSALLNVQLQELRGTCGKVAKGSVLPEGIQVFQVLCS